MTQDEIVALIGRLDPDATVSFLHGRAQILLGPTMTEAGLTELLRDVPDAQVSFDRGSPAWEGMVRAIRQARPCGPGYELDDIDEDGSWKPGRRPAGWGAP